MATRTALTNLVDAAIAEEVAFVVIAGDLYDGDWPHFGTGLFFCAAMGRLNRAGIEVFLLYGNHDAESVLTKKLPLPANVHTFGTRKATTIPHAATGAALHGWSYREKDTRDNLAATYPAALPNRLNIGVLHTALSGRPPHASYAPCTPQELASKGYDYWALGHAHDFEIVSTNPLIVFPGNIQGRSIREIGPRGAVIVTVEDDRIVGAPRQIQLDAVRWAQVKIDVGNVESESDLHARLRDGLRLAYSDKADGRPLVVRVTVDGATSLHGDLSCRRDALREEVRAIAVAISDRLWVEKVVLGTEPYSASAQPDPALRDELGTILAQGIDDDGLAAQLRTDLADFFSRTPPDLSDNGELLANVRQGDVAALIRDAATALNARLEEIG